MVLGVGGFGGQEFLEGLEGVWEESASGESNTTGGFEMGISTGKGEENMELSLEINGIDVRELDWSRVTLGKIKASIVEIWDRDVSTWKGKIDSWKMTSFEKKWFEC